MAWFKKKKSDEVKQGESQLPKLPGSEKLPSLPPLPKIKGPIKSEISSPLPPPTIVPKAVEISDIGGETMIVPSSPSTISAEPIFVKIDKFKEATANFEKIKEKVMNIGSTLKKINEIKEKEDNEIRTWENEIQLIKSRIEGIDNSLFRKMR